MKNPKKSKPLTDVPQAIRYALWLLNRRPHTAQELFRKFRKRSLSRELSDQVLEKLKGRKWLNDEAFAESFTVSRARRGWGSLKIKSALRQKGVALETIRKAESGAERDERAAARELLQRRQGTFKPGKGRMAVSPSAKAWAFLVRKGYPSPIARLAVKDVFGYNSGLPQDD